MRDSRYYYYFNNDPFSSFSLSHLKGGFKYRKVEKNSLTKNLVVIFNYNTYLLLGMYFRNRNRNKYIKYSITITKKLLFFYKFNIYSFYSIKK